MFEDLFPLGTVVRLEADGAFLMIIGRLVMSEDDEIYEYAGVPFPEGLSSDNYYFFNTEDIEDVNFIGFQDEVELSYRRTMEKALSELVEEGEE